MASSPSRSSGTQNDHCESCGIPLPLHRNSGDDARTWLCNCGQEYVAELDHHYTIEQLRNVRPEPVIFDTQTLADPSAAMLKYIRAKIKVAQKTVEKPTTFRHSVLLQLPVQAFDKMLRPQGRPFMTVSRDLSTNGVGLIHDRW